jgi:hypothetical protein
LSNLAQYAFAPVRSMRRSWLIIHCILQLVKELEQRGLHYKYTEMPCPDSIHLFDLLDSSVEMEEMYEFLLSYI